MRPIEPSDLAAELPDLRIGSDSVSWYQAEVDRYHKLSDQFLENTSQYDSDETAENEEKIQAEYTKLLIGFSAPFLQD